MAMTKCYMYFFVAISYCLDEFFTRGGYWIMKIMESKMAYFKNYSYIGILKTSNIFSIHKEVVNSEHMFIDTFNCKLLSFPFHSLVRDN